MSESFKLSEELPQVANRLPLGLFIHSFEESTFCFFLSDETCKMQNKEPRPVTSFWPSYEDSLSELVELAQDIEELEIDKNQIAAKLRKIREGRAKRAH
jgi:hypothetical protein